MTGTRGTGPRDVPADAELEALLEGETASLLGASLEPVPPPPALRARLLEQVARTPQERPALPPAPRAPSEAPDPGRADAVVVPLGRRRWRTVVLRAAACVALLGTGAVLGHWNAMDSMSSTEHFAHLNQAQDVRRVSQAMPDGHVATLTWSEGMGMTALSLPAGMSASAPGSSLQVWLRQGGDTTSLGVYGPGSGDTFSFLALTPRPGQQVLITREPRGGSAQPTSPPLVVLQVGDGTATPSPTPSPGEPHT
ncbi:anti-sigma factor [uncultured Actinomyces sp.]|uniref:anti-sigma factor n=1 Tax=uncultured Actinomyces sp. TaxID=249061 RepID=UPI0026292B83|nr:anti-sigma factor [uncultured Actinomyces sp.]